MLTRMRFVVLTAAFVACGGISGVIIDGGVDVTTTDASTMDVGTPDVGVDASIDSSIDAPTDGGKKKLDAPYVDLDAATAPWAVTVGNGEITAVAVDGKQNVLAGGRLASAPFFLDELDVNGNQLWQKTAASGKGDVVTTVAFDPSGNMFAAGYVGGPVDVGGGAIGPGGILVKYDSSGNFVWEYGPFPNTEFLSIATKSTGNIVAFCILLNGTDDYGGGKLSSTGMQLVLIEITSSKTFVNAQEWGSDDDQSQALAIDGWDDMFLAGRFAGTLDFGGGTMSGPTPGSGNYNLFIAELDTNWNYVQQMNTQTSGDNDSIRGVSPDWSGNLFAAGNVASSVNLGGPTLTCNGAFVGMVDASFGPIWSKCYNSAGGDAVVADPTGGAALTGNYDTNANVGSGMLPYTNGFYLARFNASGTGLASVGSGTVSSNEAIPSSVAYLTWPDFVVGGSCDGLVSFPSGNVNCSSDGFVARLQP